MLKKIIEDLQKLYEGSECNYDIYFWRENLFEILLDNGFMTKKPYCSIEDYNNKAMLGKESALRWTYKDVENEYAYFTSGDEYTQYPIYSQTFISAYSSLKDIFITFMLKLNEIEHERKDCILFVDLMENIINTIVPFGYFSKGCMNYLDNNVELHHYYLKPYLYDNDTPIKLAIFNNCRSTMMEQLVAFCFAQKVYEKGVDLFLKYQQSLDWDFGNIIRIVKEAKNVWKLYMPDKYEHELYNCFKNVGLNKLYAFQTLIQDYEALKLNFIPRCVYVLKRIFEIAENEMGDFVDADTLKKVNSLDENSLIEDVVEVATSSDFKSIKDAYASVLMPNDFTKIIQLDHWVGIYKCEFQDTIVNYAGNYFYQNDFIKNTIDKILNENTDKQLKDIVRKATEIKPEEKDELVKQFFLSAKGIQEYLDHDDNKLRNGYSDFMRTIDVRLDELIGKIKNNSFIYDCIACSQHILNNGDVSSANMILDYSGMVMPQIKLVERYLKELLVQFYPDNIYRIMPNNNAIKIEFKKEHYEDLTPDDLSQESQYSVKERNKDNILELGATSLALQKIYTENKWYNGILSHSGQYTNNLFDKYFIKHVRNGYFHIHIVEDYESAKELSQKTAYWFLRCIDEAPNKIS